MVKCSWDRKCSKQNSVSVTTQDTVFCVCVGVLDILGFKTCVTKKRECVVLLQTQKKGILGQI